MGIGGRSHHSGAGREEQGPNTQGPQERQSSKLHALKSLQAAIFETKQGGEIYTSSLQ